jgi:hypothetical protein
MKDLMKHSWQLLLAGMIVLTVGLVAGCGKDVADSLGCPSGSYLLNSTDTLNVPDDASITEPSANTSPAPAMLQSYILSFTVLGEDGFPRNNVCVKLYTGSTGGAGPNLWYTDDTFSTTVTGSGAMNGITVVTNDSGQAFIYWSTTTPAANFAVGTTAGADKTGTSSIMFNSGVHSKTWTFSWTVQGEPAP